MVWQEMTGGNESVVCAFRSQLKPPDRTPAMKTLHDLFEDTLKDVYFAEATIVKSLPKMIKAVTSQELKTAFSHHLEETKGQVKRLDEVFKLIDAKAAGKTCPAIEGLVEECEEIIEEAEDDDVRDAGVLACAQAIEHYEISRYGTLRAWAECLELTAAVDLLQETLDEEKAADEALSGLAYNIINGEAEDDSDRATTARSPVAKQDKKQSKSRPAASAQK